MKNYKFLALLLTLTLSSAGALFAQTFDDLYYDPETDKTLYYGLERKDNRVYRDRNYSEDYRQNRSNEEGFDYYDDYDFYYSSRIRRFHRPFYGFGFFDPVYVDMFYYDPFLRPGATILIYDDIFAFNSWYRWNRWNRWNSWGWGPSWGWNNGVNINIVNIGRGWGWDPWGWNSWNRWNSWGWGPAWGFNNWGFNSWGFNNFGGFYCPPTWGNGFVYNTVGGIRDNNTYYGPRMSGTTKTPEPNGREIRRETATDVTNSYPRNTTEGRTLPNNDTRAQPNTNVDNPVMSGRERAQSERIRIFSDNETKIYDRTINDVRNGRSDSWNRTERSVESSSRINRALESPAYNNTERRTRINDSNRSIESSRGYDSERRAPRSSGSEHRSYEPTRRSSDSGRSSSGWNRSSSGGWDSGRSSSSGSSGPRMGGSSSSGSSSGSSRGRGGN